MSSFNNLIDFKQKRNREYRDRWVRSKFREKMYDFQPTMRINNRVRYYEGENG